MKWVLRMLWCWLWILLSPWLCASQTYTYSQDVGTATAADGYVKFVNSSYVTIARTTGNGVLKVTFTGGDTGTWYKLHYKVSGNTGNVYSAEYYYQNYPDTSCLVWSNVGTVPVATTWCSGYPVAPPIYDFFLEIWNVGAVGRYYSVRTWNPVTLSWTSQSGGSVASGQKGSNWFGLPGNSSNMAAVGILRLLGNRASILDGTDKYELLATYPGTSPPWRSNNIGPNVVFIDAGGIAPVSTVTTNVGPVNTWTNAPVVASRVQDTQSKIPSNNPVSFSFVPSSNSAPSTDGTLQTGFGSLKNGQTDIGGVLDRINDTLGGMATNLTRGSGDGSATNSGSMIDKANNKSTQITTLGESAKTGARGIGGSASVGASGAWSLNMGGQLGYQDLNPLTRIIGFADAAAWCRALLTWALTLALLRGAYLRAENAMMTIASVPQATNSEIGVGLVPGAGTALSVAMAGAIVTATLAVPLLFLDFLTTQGIFATLSQNPLVIAVSGTMGLWIPRAISFVNSFIPLDVALVKLGTYWVWTFTNQISMSVAFTIVRFLVG